MDSFIFSRWISFSRLHDDNPGFREVRQFGTLLCDGMYVRGYVYVGVRACEVGNCAVYAPNYDISTNIALHRIQFSVFDAFSVLGAFSVSVYSLYLCIRCIQCISVYSMYLVC